jgi:hypothetical protein
MRIRSYLPLLSLPLLIGFSTFVASAQSRDHLTPQEIELVQESQVLDKRTEVFIKAIERRLMALNFVQTVDAKQLKKDSEMWGELPKGSRAELIGDIARILEEAITNIDDVSLHDEKNPLLAKALRKLDTTAEQLVAQLTPVGEQTKNPDEVSVVSQALESAQSIIDAAKKLPPPTEAEKAKGKNKKPKG